MPLLARCVLPLAASLAVRRDVLQRMQEDRKPPAYHLPVFALCGRVERLEARPQAGGAAPDERHDGVIPGGCRCALQAPCRVAALGHMGFARHRRVLLAQASSWKGLPVPAEECPRHVPVPGHCVRLWRPASFPQGPKRPGTAAAQALRGIAIALLCEPLVGSGLDGPVTEPLVAGACRGGDRGGAGLSHGLSLGDMGASSQMGHPATCTFSLPPVSCPNLVRFMHTPAPSQAHHLLSSSAC